MMIRMAVMVLVLAGWAGSAPGAEMAVSAMAGQSAVAAEATVDLTPLPQDQSVQSFVTFVGNKLQLKFIYDPADLKAGGVITILPNVVKISELYGLLEDVLRTKHLVMIKAKDGDWIRILPQSKAASFTQLPVPKGLTPAAANATAAAKVDVSAAVVQPEKIPGSWKLSAQPWPALETVQAGGGAPYGLYTWTDEYKNNRASILKVGWKSLRIGGPLDDEAMKIFVADEMEVMKCLQLDPAISGEKKNRLDYDSDEAFIADYMKSIDAFLTRYGPGGKFFEENPALAKRPIMAVEIWNEPNFQYLIPPHKEKHPGEVEAEREALYAKVLPAACELVKKKWPLVRVVGFGAGGSSQGDLRFFEHVFAKNEAAGKSFDILSTHPYVHEVPPESDKVESWGSYSVARSWAAIRKMMKENGAEGKPIWYTEVGWAIGKEDGGRFETAGRPTTPLLQAAYVVRLYALALRLGVGRVHIMFCTDTDGFNGGFFLRDGSWRPSAYAAQTMIKMLPRPRIEKVISEGTDGYYAFSLQADIRRPVGGKVMPVIMAWNVAGPKTVELPMFGWAADAVVTDMFGHERTVKVEGGKVKVEVGPCPVYVRYPG